MTCPSDIVRYLGFYIKDEDGIDLNFHIAERCNKDALKFEKQILTWVSNN